MVILGLETLFQNYSGVDEVCSTVSDWFENVELASVNKTFQIIDKDDAVSYYENYLSSYRFECASLKSSDDILVLMISSLRAAACYDDVQANIIFVLKGAKTISGQFDTKCNDYFKAVTTLEQFSETKDKLQLIIYQNNLLNKSISEGDFNKASIIYEQIATILYSLKLFVAAKDYFAYAAIAAEKTEKWRRISYLWYSAYAPICGECNYNDYNTLLHTFPSISFEKWKSFSEKEKSGRALQYAAYSDDNHGGPSDSYWIYEKAAHIYYENDQYGRAIECAVSATNRYSTCFHDTSSELLDLWIELLKDDRSSNYSDLLYISFNDIFRNLSLFESDSATFFYLEMQKIKQKNLLKQKHYIRYFFNKIWASFTDFGTRISKITGLTFFLVFVLFPWIYYRLFSNSGLIPEDASGLNTFIECVVASIEFFCSMGSIPNGMGLVFHLVSICETLYSYIVLIIISSYIIRRLVNQNLSAN